MAVAREIVDMTGRRVRLPESIESVFSGSMYGYAMLASLRPEMIAAVPILARSSDKKILHPHIHNLPLIEKITDTDLLMQVRPDVVIVWADTNQPYHKKSEEILTALNLPFVYVTVPGFGDVEGFPAAYEFLGKLLGCEKRAAVLAEYCRRTVGAIADVVCRVPDSFKPSVYYAEGDDGLATEFDDSLHAHLLKFLGDVNVHRGHLTGHKGMERITMEKLTEYDPDVIIAWHKSFCRSVSADHSWAGIRAVKNRRVHAIPNVPFSWFDRPPCFMRILGAKWLASVLYPDYYKLILSGRLRVLRSFSWC
jgi:iron complex transport system substrate-binding protein